MSNLVGTKQKSSPLFKSSLSVFVRKRLERFRMMLVGSVRFISRFSSFLIRFDLTVFSSISRIRFRNLVNNLLQRSYSICNSYTTIDYEFQSINDTLLKNGYPLSFIDKCIRQFFIRKVNPKCPKQNLQLIYSLDFLIWTPFPTTSKKNFTSTQKPTCQTLS